LIDEWCLEKASSSHLWKFKLLPRSVIASLGSYEFWTS
jgi:hypothetical protein